MRKRYHKIPIDQRGFLHGIRETAFYCGVSSKTVMTWFEKNGLPLVKDNDGMWMTSKDLLNAWLLTIGAHQRELRARD